MLWMEEYFAGFWLTLLRVSSIWKPISPSWLPCRDNFFIFNSAFLFVLKEQIDGFTTNYCIIARSRSPEMVVFL